MISSLVFDLDGTLADTIGDIAASMNRALAGRGFPVLPDSAYPALVGWGIRRLAFLALSPEARDDATVDAVAADALRFYAMEPAQRTTPYPGILGLVAELRRQGLSLAVLTNKPDPVARRVVDALFPGGSFALVRGDLAGAPKKPDPALTRGVLKEFGAEPASTLFVGDSAVDVATAHGVGSSVVGVSWGFRGPAELREAGADWVIERAEEVLEILEESRQP